MIKWYSIETFVLYFYYTSKIRKKIIVVNSLKGSQAGNYKSIRMLKITRENQQENNVILQ